MWEHKKYKKFKYEGRYTRDAKTNERVFTLFCDANRYHRISFESWQQAKALGWRKRGV